MKAWKITLSGTYVDGSKETKDYQNLEGYLPLVPEDQILFWVSNRFAMMWIATDKEQYAGRVTRIRETYVDNAEQVDIDPQEFGFVGKDIKDMDYEDLQYLAACKGLVSIPHYKSGGIRSQREVAYKEYHQEVLKDELLDDWQYAKAPELVVMDANVRIFRRKAVDPETALLMKEPHEYADSDMGLEDLKKVADAMGLKYKGNASKKTLLGMITGKAA